MIMVHVPEGPRRSQKERQCQLKVNIISNRKMLANDAPLSSHLTHLADYVL